MNYIKDGINLCDLKFNKYCSYGSIVFCYMVTANKWGRGDITNSLLLTITNNIYENSSKLEFSKEHKDCPCKNIFGTSNSTTNDYDKYMFVYHDTDPLIEQFKLVCNKYSSVENPIEWCLDKVLKSFEDNTPLDIKKSFSLIGYNDGRVFNIKIMNQLNAMNIKDVWCESILDCFVIGNCKDSAIPKVINYAGNEILAATNSDNYHQPIKDFIIASNRTEPYNISWDDNILTDFVRDNIYEICMNMGESYNKQLERYFQELCIENEESSTKYVFNILYNNYNSYKRRMGKTYKFPDYIETFFNEIKCLQGRKKKECKKFKDNFVKQLNTIMQDNLKAELGIQDNDSSDEE